MILCDIGIAILVFLFSFSFSLFVIEMKDSYNEAKGENRFRGREASYKTKKYYTGMQLFR